jgi:hypothetical protein
MFGHWEWNFSSTAEVATGVLMVATVLVLVALLA